MLYAFKITEMEILKTLLYINLILDGWLICWKIGDVITEMKYRNTLLEEQNEILRQKKHIDQAINYTHSCIDDSKQLVLFANWLQFNSIYSSPKQQVKDFLKEH